MKRQRCLTGLLIQARTASAGGPRSPDRETAALKRLAKIIAAYPGFGFHVNGDPRGSALFIMRPGDVPAGADIDACYNRGIAVFK